MKSLAEKIIGQTIQTLFQGGESIYQIATRFGMRTASVEAIIRAAMKSKGRTP